MKSTLKAAAAILALVAAVVIFNYFIKGLCCLMIYFSATYNLPL